MKTVHEYNFEGLPAPFHNYAGLAAGNLASIKNKNKTSYPRKAVLQSLQKMKFLMDKGYKQAVLPPPGRPDLRFLKNLGFTGSAPKLLESAYKFSPSLLSLCWSSSGMWTANSAVMSPSADCKDKKVHFTPANLHSCLHRSLESAHTTCVLKKIFKNPKYFVHHPPLPSSPSFADEGAANHNRLCSSYAQKGLEVFVYGAKGFSSKTTTKVFQARQTYFASAVTAYRHKLDPKKVLIVQQNPKAIDAGVFHNDVISTADQNLIFYHEQAFAGTTQTIKQIEQHLLPAQLIKIKVKTKDISLKTAVSSYLFNSQLLPVKKHKWLLLAPKECEDIKRVKNYLQSLVSTNSPIAELAFICLKQSMQNGGGPACLRLRVCLNTEEAKACNQGVFLNNQLHSQLKQWVDKHYRETLKPKDLLDPDLIKESRLALDELSRILKLGNIYDFQK